MENKIPYNILFNQNSPNNLTGLYYLSKDNKIKIELKEIDKTYIIDINFTCLENFNEAKKYMELIQSVLCNKNGFTRNIEDIGIKNSEKETILKFKD